MTRENSSGGGDGLTLTNFRSAEECTVSYPFAIIHGYVIHPEGETVGEITVCNRKHGINPDGDSECSIVWPVRHRCFRGVVRLCIGPNDILLVAQLNSTGGLSQLALQLTLTFEPVRNPKNFVLPVYVCAQDSNGSFQTDIEQGDLLESAKKRISTGAGLLQSASAELLAAEGYEKKTFHLLLDDDGLPRCEVFRTRLRTDELYAMPDETLWKSLQTELRNTYATDGSNCKFLAFLSDTRYVLPDDQPIPHLHEEVLKFVRGNVALGGSSLALCGTGCLYTWPESVEDLSRCLLDERPVDRRYFMDDSAYRGNRWACFSTTLGAACHELGHTFDLGHEPVGIMARGFDDIYTVFTAARPAVISSPISTSLDSSRYSRSLDVDDIHSKTVSAVDSHKGASLPVEYKVVETTKGNYSRKREYRVSTIASAVAEPKERTSLAARMSGKLFSSSKKNLRNDDMIITHRRTSAVDSLSGPDPDSCSIPSSCAISLFEPDTSHQGESCDLSTVSTRASSIASATKKHRGLLKRFSLSGSECDQVTTKTTVVDSKSLPSQGVFPKAIVTKHYNTYVVSSSAGGLDGSRPPSGFSNGDSLYGSTNQINGKSTLTQETKPSYEKSHKSPWSRLFSKKKKDRLPEFTEADGDDRMSPANGVAVQSSQATFQAGITTNANDEDVTYSGRVIPIVTEPVIQRHRNLPTLNGIITTSESDESVSPDSLEEYHFHFEDLPVHPQQYIATAISQDCLDEIRLQPAPQPPPPKNVSPPAVDGGADSGGSSTTPEPDYLMASVEKVRKSVEGAKPQPTRRSGQRMAASKGDDDSSPSRDSSTVSVVRKPRRAEELLRHAGNDSERATREVHFAANRVAHESDGHRRVEPEDHAKSSEQISEGGKTKKDVKASGNVPAVTGGKVAGNQTIRDRVKKVVSRTTSAENLLDPPVQPKSALKKKESDTGSQAATVYSREKVPLTTAASDKRDSVTPQAYRYPVDDTQLTRWKDKIEPPAVVKEEPPPVDAQKNTDRPPRVDLRVAPLATRTKSMDGPRVMTGSLQTMSKLRFPLRSQAAAKNGPKDEGEKAKPARSATLNFIPTRSTLSSRNKENKNVAAKSSDEKQEKQEKLAGSVVTRRRSFKRKSLGRNSSRKKKAGTKSESTGNTLKKEKQAPARGSTQHLAVSVPSLRLDFKQISENSNSLGYSSHKRSASRDSIGHLGTFLTTDADVNENNGFDGGQASADTADDSVSGNGLDTAVSSHRGTLPRKQHCSSLINTPSGISVMEDVCVPHRLPLPIVPPLLPADTGNGLETTGPKWTKNCAALLNYHKWFNPHVPTDPKTPPQLDGFTLSSSGGLRLIELRDVCGKVRQHWHWEYPGCGGEKAPTSFTLPLHTPATDREFREKTVIVAIDIYGNMLHRTLRGRIV